MKYISGETPQAGDIVMGWHTEYCGLKAKEWEVGEVKESRYGNIQLANKNIPGSGTSVRNVKLIRRKNIDYEIY